MKVLFIGDIVSEPGRESIKLYLESIISRYDIDVVIANGENVAHGNGITKKMYQTLLSLKINIITLGNHFIAHGESLDILSECEYLVRPYNIYKGLGGAGSKVFNIKGHQIRVTNLLGTKYIDDLSPSNPFIAIDEIMAENKEIIHIIDFHAEATAEKIALAWHVDGKCSALIGTHTHVQTADERILPNGCGYLSDVGMCGPYDGVIGMRRDVIIARSITGLKSKNEIQSGNIQFNACVIDIDEQTGKCITISRISINPDRIIGL